MRLYLDTSWVFHRKGEQIKSWKRDFQKTKLQLEVDRTLDKSKWTPTEETEEIKTSRNFPVPLEKTFENLLDFL